MNQESKTCASCMLEGVQIYVARDTKKGGIFGGIFPIKGEGLSQFQNFKSNFQVLFYDKTSLKGGR